MLAWAPARRWRWCRGDCLLGQGGLRSRVLAAMLPDAYRDASTSAQLASGAELLLYGIDSKNYDVSTCRRTHVLPVGCGALNYFTVMVYYCHVSSYCDLFYCHCTLY